MAYAVVGAEVGLRLGPSANVFDIPENLYTALALAREIKHQGEIDAADKAAGKTPSIRGYNEDSEDFAGEHA